MIDYCKNAVPCGICDGLADRVDGMFVCNKNQGHVGDLMYGVFLDISVKTIDTPPDKSKV